MRFGNHSISRLILAISFAVMAATLVSSRAFSTSQDSKTPAEIIVRSSMQLLGVPFASDPFRRPGSFHPTESKIEANCAGVVIFGLRRAGFPFRYMSARGLRDQMLRLGWLVPHGGPLRRGDILSFGTQTALLVKDAPPIGRLSDNDEILHAYYAPVEITPWKSLPYRGLRFEIFRSQRR